MIFYTGYRSEIFYEREDGSLHEIGGFEALDHQNIIEDRKTVGIERAPVRLVGWAVGLERLLLAMSGFSSIYECSHIEPVRAEISSHTDSEQDASIATDCLRTIHALVTDGARFSSLNRARRGNYREYFRQLDKRADLSDSELTRLLELNADLSLEPDIFSGSVGEVVSEVKEYQLRKNPKHMRKKGNE